MLCALDLEIASRNKRFGFIKIKIKKIKIKKFFLSIMVLLDEYLKNSVFNVYSNIEFIENLVIKTKFCLENFECLLKKYMFGKGFYDCKKAYYFFLPLKSRYYVEIHLK